MGCRDGGGARSGDPVGEYEHELYLSICGKRTCSPCTYTWFQYSQQPSRYKQLNKRDLVPRTYQVHSTHCETNAIIDYMI